MSRQNTKLFLLNIDHIVLWLCTEIQQAHVIRCIYQLHKGWIDYLFLKFISTVPFFQVTYPRPVILCTITGHLIVQNVSIIIDSCTV